MYFVDQQHPLARGMGASYLHTATAAFSIDNFNEDWLHTVATFISSGFGGLNPAGTYPAILAGRCGEGRVALFSQILFHSVDDVGEQTLLTNALGWVSGFASLISDGALDEGGGTVTDDVFGTGAQVSVPPGVLSAETDVAIDVVANPFVSGNTAGLEASGTYFVNIDLAPEPEYPLPDPGLTVVLPLTDPLPPGTPLSLFRLTFDTDEGLEPALDSSGNQIIGIVGPSGLEATFEGVIQLSTVVGLTPTAVTVVSLEAPMEPVLVDAEIAASATFLDEPGSGNHTAEFDWGDQTTSAGTVTETDGSGSVAGTHTYTEAGVYTLQVTVTDDEGGSDIAVKEFIVVYDPDEGFVTGGGVIYSPLGAYVTDPTLAGNANFGFVSRYKKGANVPTGQTQFQFQVADLNFHSSEYDWLVYCPGSSRC